MNSHLDFIDHNENSAFVQDAGELFEVAFRRNDVAARSLYRLDVKGGELRLRCFAVPHGVIFGIEQFLELLRAIEIARFALHLIWTAEAIRKWNELSAVGKMSVAAAVTIAGGDRGRAEGAAVIAAHEREVQRLTGGIAHELQ